jgi:hypothetical protein
MSDIDNSWWANERIEDKLHKLVADSYDDSPPLHLYDWLKVAHPDVFKQWEAIYEIEY